MNFTYLIIPSNTWYVRVYDIRAVTFPSNYAHHITEMKKVSSICR